MYRILGSGILKRGREDVFDLPNKTSCWWYYRIRPLIISRYGSHTALIGHYSSTLMFRSQENLSHLHSSEIKRLPLTDDDTKTARGASCDKKTREHELIGADETAKRVRKYLAASAPVPVEWADTQC